MDKKFYEKYIGKTIEIVNMSGEPQYTGKRGEVLRVDDACQLHGTWGGCAVVPSEDSFMVINDK